MDPRRAAARRAVFHAPTHADMRGFAQCQRHGAADSADLRALRARLNAVSRLSTLFNGSCHGPRCWPDDADSEANGAKASRSLG